MATIDLTLTLDCNNDCYFCPRQSYLKMIVPDSTEETFKIIKKIRKSSEKIFLSGGEATLHKKLFDILNFSKTLNFKTIGIVSNGRTLKDIALCNRLVDSGVNDFAISIYSFDEGIHDKITQRPKSGFETKKGVLNLLKLAKTRPISFRINMVLSKFNAESLIFSIKQLNFLGVKNFILAEQILLPSDSNGHLSLNKLRNKLSEINNVINQDLIIRLRGFAPCLMPAGKKSFLVHEPHNMDTFKKTAEKKRTYLRLFKSQFIKPKNCSNCSCNSTCLGLQKAYFEDEK